MSITCVHCSTPVPDGSVYCLQCGSLVSDAEGQAAATASMDDRSVQNMTQLLREDTEGEYDIVRQLGRGGMAVVFLAKEHYLDRQVAIKVLPPELTFGHGVDRFIREAKTAAALDHPNIIPIHRIAPKGKIFWYTMKYVEGRSLEEIVREKDVMSLAETISILEPVADALEYAHKHHVIHRDIKPANVMVDSNDRVVVTDFGIAKALTEATLTASGSVIGTPYYMSPEQGMGQPVCPESDQYSLGVMAYRMLSGQVPFEGTSAVDILHKHCTKPPPSLKILRPNLPNHVYYAVSKALAKAPQNRFSSVTAFVVGLKEASAEITADDIATAELVTDPAIQDRISTELMASVPPRAVTGVSLGSRLKTRIAIAAALIVGIGGGVSGTWWLTQRGTASEQTSEREQPGTFAETPSTTDDQTAQTADASGDSGEVAPAAAEQPPPPISRLTITDVPTGAAVFVDGARMRGTEFELTPGEHAVRIEAAGFESSLDTFSIAAGERLQIRYAATPTAAAETPAQPARRSAAAQTAPPPGVLRVGMRPRAVLFINGRRLDERMTHTETLPPGEYALHLESDGYAPFDTTVTVLSNDTTTVTIRLTRIQP